MKRNTKYTSIFWILASILTLPLVLILGNLSLMLLSGGDYVSSFEGLYYAIQIVWVGIPLSAISWYSVIWGKRNGKKCNQVIGMIFGILLFAIGILGIYGMNRFDTDYSYVSELGETIGFDFPKSGKFIAITSDKETNTTTDRFFLESEAVIRFENADAKDVETKIKTDTRFVTELPEEARFVIPELYSYTYQYDVYDFYMLYSVESGHANVPAESDQSFIYLMYDHDLNAMEIYKFTLNGC